MRKGMAFPVRFVSAGQTVQTTSRDLDEQSVFIRCVVAPARGEKVVLRLYLPGMTDSVQAEVGEVEADGFRARFVSLTEDARHHIRTALLAGPTAHKSTSPENRRLLPRFQDRFRVTLRIGERKTRHQALNLSASGVFVETETPPPLDQVVQVTLELPDGKPPVEVQAIVLHRLLPGSAQPAGAGLQFTGADDAFRVRLDAYLEGLRKR
ncbi:MAG TPA: PilZ domain-containing protein [Myxococcales bacterium]